MKTFLVVSLKVLAAIALGVIIIHVWPVTVVPLFAGLVLMLVLGVAFAAGLVTAGVIGAGIVAGLLAVAAVLLAALSPVWIPLAVVLAIIWLVKKLGSSRPRPAATT